MTTLLVAFANIGRGTPEQTRKAAKQIRDHLDGIDQPAVLGLNEIDEADAANEHGIFSATFRQWEDHHFDSREPILTRDIDVPAWSERSFPGSRGVERQSPARRINEVVLRCPGPNVAALCLHGPAGAHNGQRPARVKAQLLAEYARLWRALRRRIRAHHKAGRHVVILMDANTRRLLWLHRQAGVVQRHGPDWIVAVPLPGWVCHRRRHGWESLPIEPLHGLLWAVIEFRPVKETP